MKKAMHDTLKYEIDKSTGTQNYYKNNERK